MAVHYLRYMAAFSNAVYPKNLAFSPTSCKSQHRPIRKNAIWENDVMFSDFPPGPTIEHESGCVQLSNLSLFTNFTGKNLHVIFANIGEIGQVWSSCAAIVWLVTLNILCHVHRFDKFGAILPFSAIRTSIRNPPIVLHLSYTKLRLYQVYLR